MSNFILTEFCGSWCVPSQAMKPILFRLMKEYKDKVFINFINVDQNRTAQHEYNLQGCPTFILFKNGIEVERRVGAQSERQLKEMIDQWI